VAEVLLLEMLVVSGLMEAALIQAIVIAADEELIALTLREMHTCDSHLNTLALDSSLNFCCCLQIKVHNRLI
jgi:hypothetical protein